MAHHNSNNSKASERDLKLVGIGLGVSGVEALCEILLELSAGLNLAYVVVTEGAENPLAVEELIHRLELLNPRPQLLTQRTEVKRGQVFVVPQGESVAISGRDLMPCEPGSGEESPMDAFFTQLADTQGSRAIAVLLEGNGRDGLVGLQAVRNVGGLSIVQHPCSASHSEFLQEAVQHADLNLSPREISDHLERFSQAGDSDDPLNAQGDELREIFSLLHRSTGVDFGSYKSSTIRRRLLKRMVLKQVHRVEEYLDILRSDSSELAALYTELLVNVISLFRDQTVFDFIQASVIPSLHDEENPDQYFRVWVPACSSGEEVYSLAVCFLESFRKLNIHRPLQIFATDLNEASLSLARAGRYSTTAIEVLPSEIQRYFIKHGDSYQISRSVRELCIFARQDITQDPPFSHLDLVSCRNVLIYLNANLQKRALQHFHYALRPGGVLVLGTSESLGDCEGLFTTLDKRCKIFKRRGIPSPPVLNFARPFSHQEFAAPFTPETRDRLGSVARDYDVLKQADRLILARYSPPGVVVDENFDVLQFRGRTGAYLEPPVGTASLNLLKMAREGLLAALKSGVEESRENQTTVRRENVHIHGETAVRQVNLDIIPIRMMGASGKYFLILFQDHLSGEKSSTNSATSAERKNNTIDMSVEAEILYLRHELLATREYLSSIIQERESSNEELKAANEEAQSANEELQSAIEELETAKEELQSTNEELATINEEVHDRNLDLHRANSDLNNILGSVEMPVMILDQELVIRRFTPSAQSLLNVIHSDIGRPFYQVRPELEVPELESKVRAVLESLVPQAVEQRAPDGRWFSVQIRPYRTIENHIDGAVISFENITELKRQQSALEDSERTASRLLEIHPSPLALLNDKLRVVEANARFRSEFPFVAGKSEFPALQDCDGVGPELPLVLAAYAAKPETAAEHHILNLPNKSPHEVKLRKIILHSHRHVILEVRPEPVQDSSSEE